MPFFGFVFLANFLSYCGIFKIYILYFGLRIRNFDFKNNYHKYLECAIVVNDSIVVGANNYFIRFPCYSCPFPRAISQNMGENIGDGFTLSCVSQILLAMIRFISDSGITFCYKLKHFQYNWTWKRWRCLWIGNINYFQISKIWFFFRIYKIPYKYRIVEIFRHLVAPHEHSIFLYFSYLFFFLLQDRMITPYKIFTLLNLFCWRSPASSVLKNMRKETNEKIVCLLI